MPPSPTVSGTLLSAAGDSGASTMMKSAWRSLLASHQRAGSQLLNRNWSVFARAAWQTGLSPYYREELRLWVARGNYGARIAKEARYRRIMRTRHFVEALTSDNIDIRQKIKAFYRDAAIIIRDTMSSKSSRNMSMIQPTIWQWPAVVPQEWQRRLYDEMCLPKSCTVDARAP